MCLCGRVLVYLRMNLSVVYCCTSMKHGASVGCHVAVPDPDVSQTPSVPAHSANETKLSAMTKTQRAYIRGLTQRMTASVLSIRITYYDWDTMTSCTSFVFFLILTNLLTLSLNPEINYYTFLNNVQEWGNCEFNSKLTEHVKVSVCSQFCVQVTS